MANDVLSMTSFFPVCVSVLEEILIPIHYPELTELALNKIGIDRQDVNWKKQIEDVREKLLKEGRHGTFYTYDPHFYGALKSWFENKQLFLFNLDTTRPYEIKGSVSSGVDGAFEGLMRFPHMIQKNKSVPLDARAYGCARGLVIEHHVTSWFMQKWPDLILLPDNAKRWTDPCDHDFKIRHPETGYILLVDIWGPNKRGLYTKPPAKKGTHLHLQCRIDQSGQNVIWESVIYGSLYNESDNDISPILGKSPTQMIVWLNCLSQDIPYQHVRECAI